MANNKSFINLTDLELLLRLPTGSLEQDERALYLVREAENLMRETAHQPGWVGEDPLEGETLVPSRASFMGVNIAKRAIESSGNLVRRGAGPISETYRTDVLTDIGLTAEELAWLTAQRPGGGPNGFWTLKVQTGSRRRRGGNIYAPGGELMAGPDMYWAYGVEP